MSVGVHIFRPLQWLQSILTDDEVSFCLDRASERTWEEKCDSKEYKEKVKAKGIEAEVSVQPKHKFLNKYVVSDGKMT